tara:strand:- start:828 stop:1529 length:702 start_codon:yes stop_codon:yes gene_type:complete
MLLPFRYKNNFQDFMKNEIMKYSREYARKKVKLSNPENILKNGAGGGVLAFLHFGSFFLSGLALKELLSIEYTAVASRNNLKYLSDEEIHFWNDVYSKINCLYSRELFFTSEKPINLIQWLNDKKYLGVAMDVIEPGRRNKLAPFKFLGEEVFFQTSAARLARITKKPLFGMTIKYSPLRRKHVLHFGGPKIVEDELVSTQQILTEMEEIVGSHRYQFFHDIHKSFQNITEQV